MFDYIHAQEQLARHVRNHYERRANVFPQGRIIKPNLILGRIRIDRNRCRDLIPHDSRGGRGNLDYENIAATGGRKREIPQSGHPGEDSGDTNVSIRIFRHTIRVFISTSAIRRQSDQVAVGIVPRDKGIRQIRGDDGLVGPMCHVMKKSDLDDISFGGSL